MNELTTTDHSAERHDVLDAVFASLADPVRRRTLAVLRDRDPDALSREDLATALVDDPAEETRQQVTLRLHHTHLPMLTAAGLVEWEDDAVALVDHPAFEDAGVVAAIEGETAVDAESLDELFAALGETRRRTILDVLSHQFGAVHVETLARELGTAGTDLAESEVPDDVVEDHLHQLYHADLPHLADAELVEYDAAAATVAYAGHPDLPVPWMHSAFSQEFRASLTGEADPGGIGEIEGRQQVVSFGQSLCDRADEELFCMFTDTDLLEAGCLTRIRDASRRGVDVYLGTCDPMVRDYVRAQAPDVVLWEPTTGWLNVPVADDRVGRLLLADREAVMLGTLGSSGAGSLQDEQAIVGEGENDALVTMVRQLLAPHLDDIDQGAEALEASLL